MRATGRAKSSIYTHIQNIPLSDARVQKYKVAAGKHIRKFALARKGKSGRSFRVFNEWSASTILLVGHLLFDGELVHGGCIYNNRSEALVAQVESLMKEIYAFEPKRWRNPATGVNRISYHNVALSAYLKKKSKELLQQARGMPLGLKREFIRAFFDDEGCMDFRPATNHRRVRGYQKNVSILKLVRVLLGDLDISALLVPPNEVVIVGKENLIRFEKEINFSPGIYMNGNRTNSRWKKNIEKRQLLRMAIESFKS